MKRHITQNGTIIVEDEALFRLDWEKVNPHPLESVARKAGEAGMAFDATTLIEVMAGRLLLGGKRARIGYDAYRGVALDILEVMVAQGKVRRDGNGWYYIVEKASE